VLFVVAAAAEAAYAAINMLALQVFVKDVLNLTAYLGLILGAFLLVEALMKSVMGALADRYGRWRFLCAGPLLSGCTALLIAGLGYWVRARFSPNHHPPAVYHGFVQVLMVLVPLVILRALDGVAAAAFWPTMFATMADTAPQERQTSAMSTLTVAYMLGVACGPFLAGWANDKSPLVRPGSRVITEIQVNPTRRPPDGDAFYLEGRVVGVDSDNDVLQVEEPRNLFRLRVRPRVLRIHVTEATSIRMLGEPASLEDIPVGAQVRLKAEGNKIASFLVVSVLFFVTALLAFLLIPRRGPPARPHGSEHDPPLRLSDLTIALRIAPSLVVTALVVFVSVGSLAAVAPLYAKEVFHLSDYDYGKLFPVPAVVIGALAIPIGMLGDRWGRHRSVHVGIGLAAVSMALMAFVATVPALHPLRSREVLVILATGIGLGFVMGMPAWLATVSEIAGERRRAQMIGAVATAEGMGAFIGMMISPILFAQKRHVHFLLHAPMLMATFFLLVGFVIAVVTIRPEKTKPA
jgi:MFS family permease